MHLLTLDAVPGRKEVRTISGELALVKNIVVLIITTIIITTIIVVNITAVCAVSWQSTVVPPVFGARVFEKCPHRTIARRLNKTNHLSSLITHHSRQQFTGGETRQNKSRQAARKIKVERPTSENAKKLFTCCFENRRQLHQALRTPLYLPIRGSR